MGPEVEPIPDPFSRPGCLTPGIVRSALSTFAFLRSVGGGTSRRVTLTPGVSVLLAQNGTDDMLSVTVMSTPGNSDPIFDVSPHEGGQGTTAIRAQQIGVQPPRVFTLRPGDDLWATATGVSVLSVAVTEVRF